MFCVFLTNETINGILHVTVHKQCEFDGVVSIQRYLNRILRNEIMVTSENASTSFSIPLRETAGSVIILTLDNHTEQYQGLKSSQGLDQNQITFIIVGVVVGLLLLAIVVCVVCIICQKKRNSKAEGDVVVVVSISTPRSSFTTTTVRYVDCDSLLKVDKKDFKIIV